VRSASFLDSTDTVLALGKNRLSSSIESEAAMIHVTDKASEVLLKGLEANATDETQGLRLTHAAGQGYGLALDAEHEGDQVVECQGRKVLLVEEGLEQQLDGAILDAVESTEGTRLSIQMPGTEA
jgi:Fe-S cluster assembly iron-binding protein IscA